MGRGRSAADKIDFVTRVLAVDLGGTKTATALVDEAGGITDRRKEAAGHDVAGAAA